MGTAEEDLRETSALEECCCSPMFLRESKGFEQASKHWNNYSNTPPVWPWTENLQSNSHPGNKISACRYLLDARTNHPRHLDRVDSSSKWISSRMFLTSLNGIGMSSNVFMVPSFATHTCWMRICLVWRNFEDDLVYRTKTTVQANRVNEWMTV